MLAWQEAILLVKEIYALTASFPKSETYGLVGQMRRAAVSVPSNIAEGAARESTKELAQFLVIARGSLSELETQLVIARELGYCTAEQALISRVDHVFKLLQGLIKKSRVPE
ncbi:MAG: four helix bundle protein [Pseudomonadota bacterium]